MSWSSAAKSSLPYLGLLLAVWLAHGMAVGGGFHFDDSHTIELNPAVQELSRLPRIWTDTSSFSAIPENRIYRPLTFTAFNILWAVGGGSAIPFLVFKLLVHAGVATLLGLIWIELFARAYPAYDPVSRSRTAWATALIFAVHPACSEIANYVSATTSLLAAFFYAAAFLAFLRRKTAISLVLYALSCLSKEEGITLPAVLVLYTALIETRGQGLAPRDRAMAVAKRVWPWAILSLILLALILWMMPGTLKESRGGLSPWHYFITQWRAYLHYFGLSIAPFSLTVDHMSFGFSRSVLELPVVLAAFGNAVILAVAWLSLKRWPTVAFGVLWFYVAVAPASSVVPLAEPTNEHRMYLGYVGWFGALATVALLLAEESLRLRPSWAQVRAAILVVVLPFCALSQARAWVWNEPERLWKDTIDKNPENGRAMNNLALIYIRKARYPEAISLLRRCAEVWPNYPYCAINEGIALGELQRLDEADRSFQRALAIGTAQVYVNFYYAKFLEEKRQNPGMAAAYYEKAVQLSNGAFAEADSRLKRLRSLGF